MTLTLVCCCSLTTFAATKKHTVGQSYNNAIVITVKTDKATTMQFNSTKGAITFQNKAMGISNLNGVYGDFLIYVTDNSGSESPKSYTSSKSGVSFKLNQNKTYTISITPRAKFVTYNKLVESGKLWYRAPWCQTFDWSKKPDYTLTGTVKSLTIQKITSAPQQ